MIGRVSKQKKRFHETVTLRYVMLPWRYFRCRCRLCRRRNLGWRDTWCHVTWTTQSHFTKMHERTKSFSI